MLLPHYPWPLRDKPTAKQPQLFSFPGNDQDLRHCLLSWVSNRVPHSLQPEPLQTPVKSPKGISEWRRPNPQVMPSSPWLSWSLVLAGGSQLCDFTKGPLWQVWAGEAGGGPRGSPQEHHVAFHGDTPPTSEGMKRKCLMVRARDILCTSKHTATLPPARPHIPWWLRLPGLTELLPTSASISLGSRFVAAELGGGAVGDYSRWWWWVSLNWGSDQLPLIKQSHSAPSLPSQWRNWWGGKLYLTWVFIEVSPSSPQSTFKW